MAASIDFHDTTELSEQPLLAGLSGEELAALASLGAIRTYRPGEKIITAGDPATSLFFLRSGVVHVTLPDGVRLATLTAGMAFGEMALLETASLGRRAGRRSPSPPSKYRLAISSVSAISIRRTGERIMRNLAQLLADRLIVANTKVNLLTAT